MTALPLNPYDNNYLSCRLINEQLIDNKLDVTVEGGASAIIKNQPPKVVLDGTGRASLEGALYINAESPSTYQPLFRLPEKLIPTKDYFIPVVVWRAGDYIPNAISIQAAGSSINGVSVDAPGSYATLPALVVGGDGVGASLTPIMKVVSVTPVTGQSGGGSYAPGDTIEPAGGTSSIAAVFTVTHTKVQSAVVAVVGSGGTPGTQTVTGTTGLGTKFQASVTVSAEGELTSVNSITVAGDYTANPANVANEPVTGGGLTGAELNIKMGVLTATPLISGSYTALPSSPVSQSATSGNGTGATFTVLWGLLGATIVNGGQGYIPENTTITVTGGGGSGGGQLTPTFSDAVAGQVSLIDEPEVSDVVYLDGVSFLVEPYH